MINWNQLNAALRRALRVMPACGMLILIAAVVLAVFERSMQTALTGVPRAASRRRLRREAGAAPRAARSRTRTRTGKARARTGAVLPALRRAARRAGPEILHGMRQAPPALTLPPPIHPQEE